MTILQILNEIAATSSTKEKESIVRREKDNLMLKAVFSAAYNKLISYHIKKIPEYMFETDLGLEWALGPKGIKLLSDREVTGYDAISHLKDILERLNADDAIVIARIIDRDLRCGCSDSIASRVWPDVVPVFDVMLCDKDISRIKYPAFAQLKCDGARVHLYFDGLNAKAMSRSGKEFTLLGALDKSAAAIMKVGECLDGELLVVIDGKIADRQTGNGILNKANKGTISQAEADTIVMCTWDMVDTTSTIPYTKRFGTLQDRMLNKINDKIELVESLIVNCEEDAMEFFTQKLAEGQEGAVLKNMNHVWVPKRSKDLCKLKEIQSADLIVVDIFEGEGKYKGMLGGLTCETSDGLLRVNVGTGFSDELRSNFDRKYWCGSIVEVLYNMKIQSKGKDKACLFLPRLSPAGKRFDKTVANIYEELS